jgi:hypothetical protein
MRLLIITVLILGFQFKNYSQEIVKTENIELGCLIIGRGVAGEKVITNNSDYQKLIENRSPHSDCVDYELPLIDFEKHSLLSYVGSVGGCQQPRVSYYVERELGILYFKISVVQKGNCFRLNSVVIFLLIPKLEKNQEVRFDVETIQENE